MTNTTEEVWKFVPNYPGYEVSSLGRIRSYHLTSAPLDLNRLPHILNKSVSALDKYPRYSMTHVSGRTFKRGIHVLVLETFVGKRPFLHLACHRNDDQSDNRLSNLYWGTEQDNADDRVANGKQAKGCESPCSNFDEEQIINILLDTRPVRKIAKDYGVAHNVISNIQIGKTYASVAVDIPRRKPKRAPRLPDEVVLAIFKDPRQHRYIAKEYGLTPTAVGKIKTKRSYPTLLSGHKADSRKGWKKGMTVPLDQRVRGSKQGGSKLTEDNVLLIRELLATKAHTQQEIAVMFGVTRQTVSDIKLRRRWTWLNNK